MTFMQSSSTNSNQFNSYLDRGDVNTAGLKTNANVLNCYQGSGLYAQTEGMKPLMGNNDNDYNGLSGSSGIGGGTNYSGLYMNKTSREKLHNQDKQFCQHQTTKEPSNYCNSVKLERGIFSKIGVYDHKK